MTAKTIDIAKDYSKFPGGRYPEDGPFNGERFRKELLVPALNETTKLTVIIDGVVGLGSSFLEEAFGGLVRDESFTPEALKEKLIIQQEKPAFLIYKNEIWQFINAEK